MNKSIVSPDKLELVGERLQYKTTIDGTVEIWKAFVAWLNTSSSKQLNKGRKYLSFSLQKTIDEHRTKIYSQKAHLPNICLGRHV